MLLRRAIQQNRENNICKFGNYIISRKKKPNIKEDKMTISLLIVLALFVYALPAAANPACPVCTVAVAASLEIARRLGVDDSVVGVWAGALLALLGYWLIVWFDKKNWRFAGRDFLLMALSVGMIGFMYVGKLEYSPEPLLYFLFLDPFLFSVLAGAAVLMLANRFYQWMKKKNGGHAHFPFEKVAVPVLALALLSTYFYFYPLCNKAAELYEF